MASFYEKERRRITWCLFPFVLFQNLDTIQICGCSVNNKMLVGLRKYFKDLTTAFIARRSNVLSIIHE